MFRFLISALLVVFLIAPTSAQSITPQDQTAFQAIIAAQLDAFKKDDGVTAYSYAAPIVQGLFPDAEKFMTMVKHGYEPIFKNAKHSFGQLVDDGLGHPYQKRSMSCNSSLMAVGKSLVFKWWKFQLQTPDKLLRLS
jgi:hypothetical protein